MSISKDGEAVKALWPAVQLWYESAYDPEKMKMLEEIMAHNRPNLTIRQKMLVFCREVKWRVSVAFDVLRRGDESKHLDIDY